MWRVGRGEILDRRKGGGEDADRVGGVVRWRVLDGEDSDGDVEKRVGGLDAGGMGTAGDDQWC